MFYFKLSVSNLIGPSNPFVWLSDNSTVSLGFMSWNGGTGQDNCLVMFHTTDRVQNVWTKVAVIEEDSCLMYFSLVCEHKGMKRYLYVYISF